MNGYAVVSSVRLRGPVYPTVGLRLAWLSCPNPIPGPALLVLIVYLGGCQSSFGQEREQLSSAGSIWICYIEKGTTLHGGIGYFMTPVCK